MKPGQETSVEGEAVGRDPRSMSAEDLAALGHKPISANKAIRLKCLDCAGSVNEVRLCITSTCALWPFRTGVNPFRTKVELSEEERAVRAARLRRPAAPQATGAKKGAAKL